MSQVRRIAARKWIANTGFPVASESGTSGRPWDRRTAADGVSPDGLMPGNLSIHCRICRKCVPMHITEYAGIPCSFPGFGRLLSYILTQCFASFCSYSYLFPPPLSLSISLSFSVLPSGSSEQPHLPGCCYVMILGVLRKSMKQFFFYQVKVGLYFGLKANCLELDLRVAPHKAVAEVSI